MASLGTYRSHSRAVVIQRVVATVVLAAVPLTIDALADVVGEEVNAVIRTLSSVLLVPEQPRASQDPVRAFHPSFHDFVTNTDRCTDPRFHVDVGIEHGRFATRCFEHMKDSLKKDICDIRDPSLFNSEIADLPDRITKHISAAARYACLYWHFHLGLASDPDQKLRSLYTSFCEEHLLPWIEAMSLLDALGPAYNGLVALQRTPPVSPNILPSSCADCSLRVVPAAQLWSS
jgi:hypothetical protein